MRMHKLPMVYFLTTDDFQFVKVGMTKNFKSRFNNIQTGCPYKLSLWCAVYTNNPKSTEEKAIHMLNDFWVRGEWFSPDEDSLDQILDFCRQENGKTREMISALL